MSYLGLLQIYNLAPSSIGVIYDLNAKSLTKSHIIKIFTIKTNADVNTSLSLICILNIHLFRYKKEQFTFEQY